MCLLLPPPRSHRHTHTVPCCQGYPLLGTHVYGNGSVGVGFNPHPPGGMSLACSTGYQLVYGSSAPPCLACEAGFGASPSGFCEPCSEGVGGAWASVAACAAFLFIVALGAVVMRVGRAGGGVGLGAALVSLLLATPFSIQLIVQV